MLLCHSFLLLCHWTQNKKKNIKLIKVLKKLIIYEIFCLANNPNSVGPFYLSPASNNRRLEKQNLKPAPTAQHTKNDSTKSNPINSDGVKSSLKEQIGGEQKKKRAPLKFTNIGNDFAETSIPTALFPTSITTAFVVNTPMTLLFESETLQQYPILHNPQKSPPKSKSDSMEKSDSIILITHENSQSAFQTPNEHSQTVLLQDQIIPEILPSLEKKVSEKEEVIITPAEIEAKESEIEHNNIKIIPEVKTESEIKVETPVFEISKSSVYNIPEIVEEFKGFDFEKISRSSSRTSASEFTRNQERLAPPKIEQGIITKPEISEAERLKQKIKESTIWLSKIKDEKDPLEEIENEVRFALNKLTPDNFEKLKDILGLGSTK